MDQSDFGRVEMTSSVGTGLNSPVAGVSSEFPWALRIASSFNRPNALRLAQMVLYGGLVALPCFACYRYIRSFGVNVVHWDEWDVVNLLQRQFAGQLTLADLFAQHNEHRVFFGLVAQILIADATRFNSVDAMIVSWILLVVMSIVYALLWWRSMPSKSFRIVGILPVAAFVFSWRQWENLLWGWQITLVLATATFVLAIALLTTSSGYDWRFFVAIAMAIVSTFSFGNGLLTWPIGLVLAFAGGRRFAHRRTTQVIRAVIWMAFSIVIWVAYFWDYHVPGGRPTIAYLSSQPLTMGAYLVKAAGGPLTGSGQDSIPLGLSMLLLWAFVLAHFATNTGQYLRRGESGMYLGLGCTLFGILSELVLLATRSGLGADESLASRYSTFTIQGVIGLYFLIPNLWLLRREYRFAAMGCFLTLTVIGTFDGYSQAVGAGQALAARRQSEARILETFRVQDDHELQYLFPSPMVVRAGAPFLEANRLNAFVDKPSEPGSVVLSSKNTDYAMDSITDGGGTNGESGVHLPYGRTDAVTVNGWAVDRPQQRPAKGVQLLIDGQLVIPAVYGASRPDVAAYYHQPSFTLVGFSASISEQVLGRGVHTITLRILSSDGRFYYEPATRWTFDLS